MEKRKEKSGIEILIELLNEYERSKGTNLKITNWKCEYGNLSYFGYGNGYSEFLCISKKYGFIKWLVDNEKIDLRKLDCKRYDVDIPARYYLGTYIRYSIEKEMLMTLAIQDEPIKFLISILKNV